MKTRAGLVTIFFTNECFFTMCFAMNVARNRMDDMFVGMIVITPLVEAFPLEKANGGISVEVDSINGCTFDFCNF